VDVTTYHNDVARTGQNLRETALTLANVNTASFRKLRTLAVDGKVDAQPLVLANLLINGSPHETVFVGSEHGTVYAFDANTGAVLWQRSLLGANESPGDGQGCDQVVPEIGITATPVIDRASGTIWLLAMSKTAGGTYVQRLHALDVSSGAERANSPVVIAATAAGAGAEGSGGTLRFDARLHKARMGLLLLNGVVYSSWSSHCDIGNYSGWVMGHDASSLVLVSVLNLAPNGVGNALWSANTAPAADPQNNIYALTGNGTFDTVLDGSGFPGQRDFGNSFVKISTANRQLAVSDYFSMSNTVAESNADQDLGSGGAMVLPDLRDAGGVTRHLLVGAGKDQHIYLVDRDNLGKFSPSSNRIYQDLPNGLGGGEFGMPAWFNGAVYYGAVGTNLAAFRVSNARLPAAPNDVTATVFGYPGTTPSVSANGSGNGIVWAIENGGNAVLHAYDAANLAHELYNSAQAASGRDTAGPGNKFMTPTVASGKVYVPTTSGVTVYGLGP
jgi:outer membrane protein assembly factor BamB